MGIISAERMLTTDLIIFYFVYILCRSFRSMITVKHSVGKESFSTSHQIRRGLCPRASTPSLDKQTSLNSRTETSPKAFAVTYMLALKEQNIP